MPNYFAFQWHICDDCDQRCKHCYIFAEDNKKPLTHMNFSEMKKVVANCEEFCHRFGRTPYFYITGGDPILNPHFFKLLYYIAGKGYPMTIMGNPFHLTYENCEWMAECGVHKYQVSIDGMEETHDWFRKPGSFQATLESLDKINRSGMDSVIMTTVSKLNYQELPDIIDTAVKYKAGIFAFSRYVPTSDEKAEDQLTPEEYHEVLKKADEKFKYYESQGVDTYFSRKDHLWTLLQYENGEFQIPETAREGMIYGGCNCGAGHFTILPDGEVYACRRVGESKVGNVFEDYLSNLWLNQMEEYREYTKFTKCAKCELLAWCRGCPAVAKGTYGSFYSPDPQCWKKTNNITGDLL